jgi:hypothetical protein
MVPRMKIFTDIYYMLGHLGWVRFSNRVSVNTHKQFTLEILMTMAPILDEGVPSLSFHLEGVKQVVPYAFRPETQVLHIFTCRRLA